MADAKSGNFGTLSWGMNLDTSDFKKKMKQVRKNTKKWSERMTAQFKSVAKGVTIIGAAFAAAGAGILIFTKNILEANNAQILLANSLGATQADVAALTLGADRFGVKTKALIDRMREIGGIEAFSNAAEEVKNAGNEVDQLNKAMELFGNQGGKILSVLQQGKEGIAAMKAEALDLGLALTPEQVAQNNVVWTIWEDTLFSIQGLSKQIGLRFAETFGTMSAGIRGFVTVFKNDILLGAEFVAEKFNNFMLGTLDLFSRVGIPFINAFISFANQIGMAFETLFSFLSPATDSAIGGLLSLFSTVTDFIATFKQSMIIGITKPIEAVIRGAFNGLALLSGFIGDQITAIAAGLSEIGVIDDNQLQAISDSFVEQRLMLRKTGRDFAKPFADAQKDAEKDMVNILTDKFKKDQKQQMRFKGIIGEFTTNFGKALEKAAEVPMGIMEEALNASVSDKFAGLALSGSQAEATLKNDSRNREQFQRKNINGLAGIEKAINNLEAI